MPASRRKTSNFEGADCNSDVEWVRWRKKICRGGITFGRGNDRYDKTYITHLDRLLGFPDLKVQQDEDDPMYKMFLENLMEHGVPFPLKYEAKDGPSDKLKGGIPISYSSSSIQKSRSLGVNCDLEACTEKFGSLEEDTLSRKKSCSSMVRELKSGMRDSGSGTENTEISGPKNLMNTQKKNPISKPSEKVSCSSGLDPRSNLRADTVKNTFRVLSSGLKVKNESIFIEYGDGKRVHYEENDEQKSANVQNGPSKTVRTEQILSSRPPVPAPNPRKTTPTLRSSHQQKLTDVQHGHEPSKTVHTVQIPSSRPPVLAPTPRQTTPTLRAHSQTCSHTPRSLTAKNHDRVANRLSETACTTQIPTRQMTESPTPTARGPISTGQDHRSNSRVASANRSCLVFVCGLEAHRGSTLHEYGDVKGKYYKQGYQQKSTDVQKKPLETAPTMQIPTFRPPAQSLTSSQPNLTTRTPSSTHAATLKSLTGKGHCDVHSKPSETASKAQVPVSRPTPSQPTSARSLTPRAPTSSSTLSTRTSVSKMLMSKGKGKAAPGSLDWILEKLEQICRKPFEQKEYEDLLKEVNVRKPILCHKDTRRGGYEAAAEEMGKSYLDNFPDLDNEIKKVKSDPKKVLNLLRGFTFYLLHVPHGIQMPWKIPACMAIMLGSA